MPLMGLGSERRGHWMTAQALSREVDDSSHQAVRHEDVGEKIGGARKDQWWSGRWLALGDFRAMDDVERAESVRKDNIWPRIDYRAMRDAGVEAAAAYLVKRIKDGIHVQPVGDRDAQEAYLKAVSLIRDELAEVKTCADVEAACKRIEAAFYEVKETPRSKSWTNTDFLKRFSQSDVVTRRNGFMWVGRNVSKVMKFIRHPPLHEASRKTTASLYIGGEVKSQPTWHRIISERSTRRAKEEGKDVIPRRPYLEGVKRAGPDVRGGRDITGEDLLEEFGFRGIEYGLWLNQHERQQALNHVYEGLCDLADALDVPRRALSLEGTLALSFGSRGKGRYAAHYEPLRRVINLTKPKGAGSLAHEFGHALDDWCGRKLQDKPHDVPLPEGCFLSEHTGGGMRRYPDVSMAFGETMQSIRQTRLSVEEVRQQRESEYERAREQIPSWFCYRRAEEMGESSRRRFDALMEAALDPEHDGDPDALAKEISDLHRREKGRGLDRDYRHWGALYITRLRGAYRALQPGVLEAMPTFMIPTIPSKYLKQAEKLDRRRKAYYATGPELFARAFESAIHDRLADMGRRSEYLVQGVEEGRFADERYRGDPYPAGDDRQRINQSMDALFAALRGMPEIGQQPHDAREPEASEETFSSLYTWDLDL